MMNSVAFCAVGLVLASCGETREPVLAAQFGATSTVSAEAVFDVRCSAFTGVIVAEQSRRGEEWIPTVFRDEPFRCESDWTRVRVVHTLPLVRLRIASYVSGSITFAKPVSSR